MTFEPRTLRLSAEEAEAIYDELDSLIPQGEHHDLAPGYLGERACQRLMYFLRVGDRLPLTGPLPATISGVARK
jgi:hypothetical protein